MRTTLGTLVIIALVGCNSQDKSPPAAKPAERAAMPSSGTTAQAISGTVAEVIDVATYTYVRLTTGAGEMWAAIPTTKVAVGEKVTLVNPQAMQNFTSKTLNRTFDVIQFASGLEGRGAAAPAAEGALPEGHPAVGEGGGTPAMQGFGLKAGAKPGEAAAAIDPKVEKATGADAKTVAELFAQKTALKDKAVTVRGKVVKVTTGVLGKNWLHLRDGSGAEASKDNDIIVTSAATAAIGDTVTVKGPVHLDRDFGAGYAYSVIIEDASVTK